MLDEESRELLETLNRNVVVLKRELGQCYSLIYKLIGRYADCHFSHAPQTLSSPTQHESRFRESIVETIMILDESRKSFKSKKLEILRKKLTQVLMEDVDSARLDASSNERRACCGDEGCAHCDGMVERSVINVETNSVEAAIRSKKNS